MRQESRVRGLNSPPLHSISHLSILSAIPEWRAFLHSQNRKLLCSPPIKSIITVAYADPAGIHRIPDL